MASASLGVTAHSQTHPLMSPVISSTVPVVMMPPVRITRISSAMYSTSETMCVERMTILSWAREDMRLRKRTRSLGSSPAVGSSSTRTDGSLSTAWAMPSRCFMPPEKVLTFRFAASARPTTPRSSRVRTFACCVVSPLSDARYIMKSQAVKSG